MNDSLPFPPEALPNHFLLLASTQPLHLVAWIAALVIGFRRRWWWSALMLVPIFYPLGLLVLAVKRDRWIHLPITVHVLALLMWFGGGAYMRSVEWRKLMTLEQALTERGEILDPVRLHGTPEVMPENNVWDHPTLKTLAQAGQSRESELDDLLVGDDQGTTDIGSQARARMDEEYGWIALPEIAGGNVYEFHHAANEPLPAHRPLEALYAYTLAQRDAEQSEAHSVEADRDRDLILENEGRPLEANSPPKTFANTPALLDLLASSVERNRPRFEAWMEALGREQDVYPFAHENGPAMLLPHLTFLKKLSDRATRLTLFHVYRRDAEASFKAMQDLFLINQTGLSDDLICRVVQQANWQRSLAAIVAVQNQHLWSDWQWQWMQERLSSLRFLSRFPRAVKTERAMFTHWLKAQADEDVLTAVSVLDQLGGEGSGTSIAHFGVLWHYLRSPMQAFYIKQIRLLHHHYDELDAAMEGIVHRSREEPWSHLPIEIPNRPEFGLFSGMLIRSLESPLKWYFQNQLTLETAKLSIALERYYLKHHRYPEQLDALIPEFLQKVALDPMSARPFHYQVLEPDGFELYSVGWNGRDDQGFPGHHPNNRRVNNSFAEKETADDILWRVEGKAERFPILVIDQETPRE